MNDAALQRQGGAAVAARPQQDTEALTSRTGSTEPYTMRELQFYGQMVHEAGLVPKDNTANTPRQLEARAMAKIVAGKSYGFDPVLSLRAFDVINGKLQPTSECIAVLVKRSGKYNYRVKTWTTQECTLSFYERMDGKWVYSGDSTFTMEDAKKAGYSTGANKANYDKVPRNMLYARALTNGKRLYCADVMDPAGYMPSNDADIPEAEVVDESQARDFQPAPEQIAAAPAADAAPTPAADEIEIPWEKKSEPAVVEGQVVDEERAAIEQEPPFSPDEAKLVDLRTAALDAYNATKGESRKRAADWLGSRTIIQLNGEQLTAFIEASANF